MLDGYDFRLGKTIKPSELKMKLLRFNEPIKCGTTGNIRDYAVSGWALGENSPDFSWTEAAEARLQFNAQSTSALLNLHISGFPFLADGRIDCQRVWVHLNGMYCGIFSVNDNFEQVMQIRGSWLEPKNNFLTLTLPYAKSPAQLGMGEDRRILGLGIRSVILRTL